MAESRSDSSGGFVDMGERVKEENHEAKRNHHHKETHGLRDDIDDETLITDVKAPNVFERAKEEIEAIVEAIHSKNETRVETTHRDSFFQDSQKRDSIEEEQKELNSGNSDSNSEGSKSPNLLERERGKEDMEGLLHNKQEKKSPKDHHHHHHHKESHGKNSDLFDENTPISEVKGPSLFQRAKEELEAIFDTIIHPNKDSANASKKQDGGFKESIGKGLEKICSPKNHHHSSRD